MEHTYTRSGTALLFIDPYNDFLSGGGKLWPYVQEVAGGVQLHRNLGLISAAVRRAGMRIFIVPHHRREAHDYESWAWPNPDQLASGALQTFAKDTWGGDWHPDHAPQPGDMRPRRSVWAECMQPMCSMVPVLPMRF
jgi:nicotinamidase-related amidase